MSLKIVELSDNNRWDKIRPEEDWSLVLADKTILFNAICNLLLNSENLFYYASQKSTCTNLEDCREYIRRLIKDGTIATRLAPVLSSLGWTSDELDTSSTVLAGDIGEYLMAILVDKFLPIRTIVCKVSLKTNSSMPSFLVYLMRFIRKSSLNASRGSSEMTPVSEPSHRMLSLSGLIHIQ